MGITCNMHPAQYIPMERGEKGSSLQFNSATRLIKSLAFFLLFWHVYRSVDCAGASRHHWVPLTPDIAEFIGVAKEAASPLRNGARPASQMQASCSSRRMLPGSTCHQKRDTQLGFWMASSAGSVSSVTNPLQTALSSQPQLCHS